MKLDHVFPTPIYTVRLSENTFIDTKQRVNDYCNATKIPNLPTGELKTTFYDHQDYLGKISAKLCLQEINIRVREFFHLQGFSSDCFIDVTSWLQIYPPDSFFIKHDHYGAITSGVIYLQVPENSGDLRFYDPIHARRVTNVFFKNVISVGNEYNFQHINYTPKEGEMIIFPPWLEHSVEFNRSSEERIAVSFNIWAKK